MATNHLILSLKISILSLTVLSLSILFKFYVPSPSEWGSLRSWLARPYLYVIINFIIITIAASSRFQHKVEEEEEEQEETMTVMVAESPVKVPVPVGLQQSFSVPQVYEEVVAVEEVVKSVVEVESESVMENLVVVEEVGDAIGNEEMLIGTESMEAPVEYSVSKPPVSARFGHRKMPKGSPEAGKLLRVSKPKRQDTLESTWKMITEGRSMPLARHLKKSDTWETHSHAPKAEQVKKSDTFNSRSSVSSVAPGEPPNPSSVSSSSTLTRSQGSGSMKLRKEPSLGQDELNRRVEAFINKFNEEMRLQRLESLNRYKEMVV